MTRTFILNSITQGLLITIKQDIFGKPQLEHFGAFWCILVHFGAGTHVEMEAMDVSVSMEYENSAMAELEEIIALV